MSKLAANIYVLPTTEHFKHWRAVKNGRLKSPFTVANDVIFNRKLIKYNRHSSPSFHVVFVTSTKSQSTRYVEITKIYYCLFCFALHWPLLIPLADRVCVCVCVSSFLMRWRLYFWTNKLTIRNDWILNAENLYWLVRIACSQSIDYSTRSHRIEC